MPTATIRRAINWRGKPDAALVDWSAPITKGLIAWWLLGEGGGLTAHDLVARPNNPPAPGTLTNGAAWGAGKFGTAVTFDGTNDYVSIGDVAKLSFERADIFSISLWYRASATSPTAQETLISKLQNTGRFAGWEIQVEGDAANDPYRWLLRADFAGNPAIHVEFPRSNDTNWHHVVVTYNGNLLASGVTPYVDGVPATKTVTSDTMASQTTDNAEKVNLGARATTAANFLNGRLDNVRVCGRVFTAFEVSRLYSTPFEGLMPRYHYLVPAAAVAGQPAMRRLGGVLHAQHMRPRERAVRSF